MPIKVFYLKGHEKALDRNKELDIRNLLCKQEIQLKDVFKSNKRLVLFKEGQLHYFKDEANVPEELLLMMSKWWEKPYPGQEESYESYMQFIKEKHLGLNKTFHVSGHAYTKDLKHLAESINPRILLPVHTESPEKFELLLDNINVKVLEDNEALDV